MPRLMAGQPKMSHINNVSFSSPVKNIKTTSFKKRMKCILFNNGLIELGNESKFLVGCFVVCDIISVWNT